MPWAIIDKASHKFVSSTNWEHAHPLSSLSTDQAELFQDKADARYEMMVRELNTQHYKIVPVRVIVKLADD